MGRLPSSPNPPVNDPAEVFAAIEKYPKPHRESVKDFKHPALHGLALIVCWVFFALGWYCIYLIAATENFSYYLGAIAMFCVWFSMLRWSLLNRKV